VEDPAERDEVEDPAERDEVEDPAERDEVEDPAERNEVEDPAERDEVEDPAERDEVEDPAERDEVEDPERPDGAERPDGTERSDADRAEDRRNLADRLQEGWQETARKQGKTERPKPYVTDTNEEIPASNQGDLDQFFEDHDIPEERQEHYRVEEGKIKEDILNMPNHDLSPGNAKENDASADVVLDGIEEQVKNGGELNETFKDNLSDRVHQKWLDRHGDEDWVPDVMKLPYQDLKQADADEAKKDRDMVDAGVDYWQQKYG
jgi:hypothetical protein